MISHVPPIGWGQGCYTYTLPCPLRRSLKARVLPSIRSSESTSSPPESLAVEGGSAWGKEGTCRSTATLRARSSSSQPGTTSSWTTSHCKVRRMFVLFAPSGDPPCAIALFQLHNLAMDMLKRLLGGLTTDGFGDGFRRSQARRPLQLC